MTQATVRRPQAAQERRLIAALRRRGLLVTAGWLVDRRRDNRWKHPRVIEMERPT